MIIKIELKQEDNKGDITVEALLDSGAIGLVMSLEFVRKNQFKKKKLDRLIYVRAINSIFNYERLIEHIVEVESFYRRYKKRMEINVIGEQKWSVILEMPWLVYHNLEINWKTEEVKMIRCPDRCGKQWKTKEMKPEWQKQKKKKQKKEKVQRENKKEFRKSIVEEEIEIAGIVEEKQKEEEDLMEIRAVNEIVPKRFHKYLKMLEKKESERMLTKKT